MPKTNIAQLAVEQEATPGTAETLVAADVLVRLRNGYSFTPEHDLIDLEEISDNSSKTAAVIGRKSVTFAATYILRGPGSTTTDPAIVDLWESAMFDGDEAYTENIGSVSSGPYVAGETITGGTSSATGLVLQQTADGASSIPYIALSGTFQDAETITGGTSGATCTSSGTPSNVGFAFRPADWSSGAGHHVTVEGLRGGTSSSTCYMWQGRGCLSDIQWEFTNGGPCIVTQNFVGALSSQGDQATYTVSAYPESTVTVPKFLNVGMYLATVQPTGVVDMTINYPTNPTFVEDANDSSADGVLYADYSRDLPIVTLAIDQTDTGTYDYFSTLQAGTTIRFEFTHGSATGAKWTFAAPAAQFRSITPGEREPNRATFELELGLTGDNNNELLIWQH